MQSDKDFFENNEMLKYINESAAQELKTELLNKRVWSFDDLINFPGEENNYLIENFLWENQVIFLIAKDKVGKSILTKQMCCCLSSGTPFLDSFDVPRPVKTLYIQLEGDRVETKTRLQSMSKAIPVFSDNFRYIFRAKLWLNVQADVEKLIEDIDGISYRPDVIFVDPLYTAVKGSLSSDDVASGIICSIRMIQEKYNCCVVVVHHEHKTVRDREGNRIDEGDEAIMGSSLFKNFANHVLRLTVDRKTKIRELSCNTQRNSKVASGIKLRLQEEPALAFHIEGKSTPPMQQNIVAYLKIHGKRCVKQICEGTGISNEVSVRNALSKLYKENLVAKTKEGQRVLYDAIQKAAV